MIFLWPWALLLPVVLMPALTLLWFVSQKRRRSDTVLFTDLELIEVVVPDPPGKRRAVSALILGAGLIVVLIGTARPVARFTVTAQESTVMLAIDVSLSMEATDFPPNRLEAASDAARVFLENAPSEVKVGLVTFAGTARVIVPPTRDRSTLRIALESLQPEQGTAIGEGIMASLQGADATLRLAPGAEPEGGSTSILLLSDGENTVGRDPIEAADRAKASGVPVSTVAIGTPEGRITVRGTPVRVNVNEEQLRRIASTTGGQFFSASSPTDLASVYRNMGRQVAQEFRTVEITAVFALVGSLLIFATAVLSLFWVRNFP